MTNPIDIRRYNSRAWDVAVEMGSEWTLPVDAAAVAAARRGEWSIVLTPTKPIPAEWFPPFDGAAILCLASGGGQQGPILAAAGESVGATVVVFDNSPRQLARDREVARREGLKLTTVEGDMRDLSRFAPNTFDLILHPCSNLFVPDVRPVWLEAARVLKPGGTLLSGFINPILYLFDQKKADDGILEVRHKLPYSDMTSISDQERTEYMAAHEALEFGHTLTDQIAGQIDAGLMISGFYEDGWPGMALHEYTEMFVATRAVKV